MQLASDQVDEALAAIYSGTPASTVETEFLDFKEPHSRGIDETAKLIMKAAVCFANSNGGTIVVGVSDETSGPDAFVGCDLHPATVQARVMELSNPPVTTIPRQIQRFDMTLLVVDVPQSFDIHADKQGRATRRLGTSCLSMSPDDQQRLREERRGVDWSAQPSDRDVRDVSAEAISAARVLLANAGDDRREIARLAEHDLLRALGVVSSDGRLLRAGDVLFCEPMDAPAVVYQHRRTAGGESVFVERLNRPLVLAFQQSVQLIDVRSNATPVTIRTGQQVDLLDYPGAAVREALSNALLHRDYRLPGSVQIEHSPDTLVVSSPGPLVGGVRVDNILTHPSAPRNRTLAAAARKLRLAEETGRGVDRMFREMVTTGKDLPVIEDKGDTVRVVLMGGSPRIAIGRYISELPEDARNDTDALLTLFELCHKQRVSAKQLAPVLQKTEIETRLSLQRLVAFLPTTIELSPRTRRRSDDEYQLCSEALQALGSAVKYRRRTTDTVEKKIALHLNEYGRINNRTVRNLFDVDVNRARDILAGLVDRGVIVRTSEATRGPTVEYKAVQASKSATRRRSSR